MIELRPRGEFEVVGLTTLTARDGRVAGRVDIRVEGIVEHDGLVYADLAPAP